MYTVYILQKYKIYAQYVATFFDHLWSPYPGHFVKEASVWINVQSSPVC